MELARLENERAVLRALPGHREVYGFATDARLAAIGKVVGEIVGRRMRVVMDQQAATGPMAGSEQPPGGEAGGSSAHPGGDVDAAGRGGGGRAGGGGGSERREAMGLPLVRQVFEIFPEASLIDVRAEERTQSQASEGESSEATDEGEDVDEEAEED